MVVVFSMEKRLGKVPNYDQPLYQYCKPAIEYMDSIGYTGRHLAVASGP